MKSVLIANRGEIACRIIRTARQRGLRTIAVYSEPDRKAKHVKLADEAVCIGPALATESYLSVPAILSAAEQTGADAIHPGYGFLSENPDFVDACNVQGVRFIGPSSDSMRAMGQKDAAKRLMEQAGVPVVPGYHGENQNPDFLKQQAEAIGFPVLIKARAGGGGKGMRRVNALDEFHNALESAQREAQASFGDAHVLIEKFVANPRHIEVQVFGDSSGQMVHLFERDCSLQRRHQKVIEEAPAPGMTPEMRDAMTAAAVKAAAAIQYEGAGTIEFIVDSSRGLRPDAFWFMEMNTRLQVEHPVTEAITGVDLVDWQFRIAMGEPLPLNQNNITMSGHAVEARLYAEDPTTGFLPATGRLHRFELSSEGRVDTGVDEGDEVLPHYDPLLAKLITHSSNRTSAFAQLAQQLSTSVVMGMETNREFLWRLLCHEDVIDGRFDTAFIEQNMDGLVESKNLRDALAVAALAVVEPCMVEKDTTCSDSISARLGAWQLWGMPNRQVQLRYADKDYSLRLSRMESTTESFAWVVSSDTDKEFCEEAISVSFVSSSRARINGVEKQISVLLDPSAVFVQLDGSYCRFERPVPGGDMAEALSDGTIASVMPGRIVAVNCNVGDRIKAQQALISMEAMKMEQDLSCGRDGVVEEIYVSVGDQVEQGAQLLRLSDS